MYMYTHVHAHIHVHMYAEHWCLFGASALDANAVANVDSVEGKALALLPWAPSIIDFGMFLI